MSKVWVQVVKLQNVLSVSRSAGLPVGQAMLPKNPALKDSAPPSKTAAGSKLGATNAGISVTCAEHQQQPQQTQPLWIAPLAQRFVQKLYHRKPCRHIFNCELRTPWRGCKRLSFWLLKTKNSKWPVLSSLLSNIIHSKSSLNLSQKPKKAKKARKPKPINPQKKAPKQAKPI